MNEEEEQVADPRGVPGLVPFLFIAALTFFFYGQFVRPPPETLLGTTIRLPILYAIYIGAFAVVLWLFLPGRLPPREEETDGPVCQHCLDPFREGVHFCPRCAAPLTTFAATGGYEYIFSWAWAMGRAAHGPTRPLHALGLALITLPFFITAGFMGWSSWTAEGDTWGGLGIGFELGLGFLYLVFFINCLKAPTEREWSALPREERVPYGSPPWWTYDLWWTLPLEDPEEEPEEEDDEWGDEPPPEPPPLPT